MFNLVRSITFDILGTLGLTHKNDMSPLPTILTLKSTWIHVCSTNSCNMTSYVEASVDKSLGRCTALWIPDINPNDRHIWFGRNFDNTWFRSNSNIIKDVSRLNDWLYYTWIDRYIGAFDVIRNT